MLVRACLLTLAAIQPAYAAAADAPYYGPMKAWRGIGFKFGVKEELDKQGSWRVTAATRRGEAVDLAMYRAAELAREQGHAYVEFLGGTVRRSPGHASATVYARPSHSPASPAMCRSKRQGTCYTADVAEVLRILGGPGGSQPGVAITDHFDEYGRAVRYSGFGIGAASAARPRPAAPVPSRAPASVAARSVHFRPVQTADDRFEAALKEVQPVRGRDRTGAWTISD